ncbi:glycosyltransferase [candidate division KSB1 bacterium]|nr:glycosyltransferase [candidate division KSB1 bacterium]
MKILFLPKEFPHARVVGGPIIIYNRMKYLSQNHEVHLLSFIGEEQREFLPTVERYCQRIELLPFPKRRGAMRNIVDFLFFKTPNYMLTTYSKAYRDKVAEMAREENYDCIISEYTVMGQYLYRNKGIPVETVKVMSVHECYTTARYKVWKAEGFSREGIEAYLYYVKLKDYEFRMYESADLILTLTQEGKEELLGFNPDLNVEVVPHGVDVEHFHPYARNPEGNVIVFLGNFRHEPNVDAVLYFCAEIFPLIKIKVPDAVFYAVGQGPPSEILGLAQEGSVVVTGYVPDVKPYFDRAKVSVVPVRLGGGFRGKALEAMACGVPLVSTSLGAEGIGGRDREHLLIADQPEGFAEGVVQVLTDDGMNRKLSVNGRKLIEEKFSWQKGVEKLEEILKQAVARKN